VSEFDEGWDACLQALKDQFGEDYSETNANEDYRVHKPETDGQMLTRLGTDAQLWADEYLSKAEEVFIYDLENFTMTWFANAIEAGRSAGEASGWEEGHLWASAARACECESRERQRVLEGVLDLCDDDDLMDCWLLANTVVNIVMNDA
jgi:hypothetical protein